MHFLRDTMDSYSNILHEIGKAFIGIKYGYTDYINITTEHRFSKYDYDTYSEPLEEMKIHFNELKKMKNFLVENYPTFLRDDCVGSFENFTRLIALTEELLQRADDFLMFEPQVGLPTVESATKTTMHFDLMSASIERIESLLADFRSEVRMKLKSAV
ncbi:MAG: hypothetical protein FH748_12730 [Balneolaceae bacterium]|nr:hypothetical protein [Balneolaceae bacterium]